MDIYFVRHGQTPGNAAKRHQAEETPLSDLGESQAREAAKKIADLKPTHLLSSHLIRAIKTAQPISEATNLDIEINHNFTELIRPKYLHGKLHYSWQSSLYYFLWFLGIENRKLAGESYGMVRQRIAVAQSILKRYPEDARVVVISHSVFMNLFLAHMCRQRALSPLATLKFISKVLKIPNGSIVHVHYDEKVEGLCRWLQLSGENT